MKKVLLWVTAFTLGLASCQKSEIVDDVNAGSNELNFGVYQGKATRAGELMNDDLTQEGVSFPLHAYRGKQTETKTKYFDETLTYGQPETGKWNTSIPRFLPEGSADFLQFYAYYAHNKNTKKGDLAGATYNAIPSGALTTDAYPTLEYIIQKNGTTGTNPSGTDIDLVAASVNDNVGTSITIPFKHILSQINFGVKGYYGAKIKIGNIKINQVLKEGTFSFNPDPTKWGWTGQKTAEDYEYTFAGATNAAASAYTTPGGVENNSKWEDSNGESDNIYILGDGGNGGPGTGADAGKIWYVTAADDATQGSTIADRKTGLSNSLMLMPQSLTEGMDNAFVTFEYTITDLEDNIIIGGNDPEKGQFDLNMKKHTDAYANQWKPNLRYVYIIDFTGYLNGQLLSFTVDVETNPWENYDKPGEGFVYLSSTGQPVFNEVKDAIKKTGDAYSVAEGHVFSNITWDWSFYTMTDKVFTAAGQTFTVDFSKVIFNGNKITVKAPIGFTVSNLGVANVGSKTLTFTSIAAVTKPTTAADVQVSGVIPISTAGALYKATDGEWALSAPTATFDAGESFTIDASKVWLNGWEITITIPEFKQSGKYPKYIMTKNAPTQP